MNPLHQTVVNDVTLINARLLDSAKNEENGRFVSELLALERCANYARTQLQRRTVLDMDDVLDDEL